MIIVRYNLRDKIMTQGDILNQNPITADAAALGSHFDTARILAAADETHADDLRYDAETIAQYIIDLPPTILTVASQEIVRRRLILSQMTDEELSGQKMNRDATTAALTLANTNFLDAQRLEYRAALARLSVF
jgi:hypothetical protein